VNAALLNTMCLALNLASLVARRDGRVRRTAFENPRERYAPVCDEEELNAGPKVEIRAAKD